MIRRCCLPLLALVILSVSFVASARAQGGRAELQGVVLDHSRSGTNKISGRASSISRIRRSPRPTTS